MIKILEATEFDEIVYVENRFGYLLYHGSYFVGVVSRKNNKIIFQDANGESFTLNRTEHNWKSVQRIMRHGKRCKFTKVNFSSDVVV